MGELIDSTRVRVLLNDSIQKVKTKQYPHNNAMFKSFRGIFDDKLKKELASIRQKNTQPLLDTVLTE